MARLLRLVTAVSVLLVASLTGCLLSADQSAAMDVISVNAHGQNVRQLWSGGLPFAGAGMIIVALAVYSIRMRRSLCRLSISHANQNRFLEAIDQSHMGIVLFDAEMKTTCRSNGFDRQFADLIPLVSAGASIVQICAFAFENGVFTSDLEGADPDVVAGAIAARANEGQGDCRIVRTLVGQAFDMRVFRLDSGGFAALWLDISDVCHQQEKIAAHSRAVERNNQQLSAFSALVAHDLCGPLRQQSALVSFIREDIATAGMSLPSGANQHLTHLVQLSQRMSLLVQDLLADAEADQGRPTSFAPSARLHAVLALAVIDSNIEVVIAPDMPAVMVRPQAFDMVMRNLVANAAKHHDRACGRITLRARRLDQDVVIEVEDDGPGISPARVDEVFKPFCRLTEVHGAGLGLAMVRKAVREWGGEVNVRAAPVRGCIFRVSMPAAIYGSEPSLISWTQDDAAGQTSAFSPFDPQNAILQPGIEPQDVPD